MKMPTYVPVVDPLYRYLLISESLLTNILQEERAPNIVNMVNAFNRIALAVTTDILAQSTPQGRAAVIFFFIKV